MGMIVAAGTGPRWSYGQEPATSLAGYAPKDARFFAELHQLGQLRRRLDETGAWKALMYLVSPTEGARVDTQKGRRLEGLLGISLADAVSELFGEQVAVAAPDWTKLGAGIVITRISGPDQVRKLIQQRRGLAQNLPGGAELHQISNELWLATNGRIAVFGARGLEDEFFEQSMRLLFRQGQDSLANSATFVEQVTELPGGHLGLLYTEMPVDPNPRGKRGDKSPQVVMPSWWPATWPDLRLTAVGMYAAEGGDGVDLALRGRVNDSQPDQVTGGVSPDLLARLPRSTLAAWSFSLDYLSAFKGTARPGPGVELDERHLLLELVRTWRESRSLEEMLLQYLGQETIVILGQRAPGPEALGESFIRPMLSVMIRAKDTRGVRDGVNEVMNILIALTNLRIAADNTKLAAGQPPTPLLKARNEIYRGTMIWEAPWGRALQSFFRFPFLSEMHLSWAVFDDWLVVSTDPVHIRQLLDARGSEDIPEFGSTEAFRAVRNEENSISMVVSQPAEASRVIRSWINYLRRSHPEILEANWWQGLFSRPRVELGIGFTTDPKEAGVLVVNHVVRGMPAAGVLRIGDRIEAIDGRTLDLKETKQSFRTLMENRPKPEEVVVRIRRGEKRMDIPIRIAGARRSPGGFDPIQAVRDLMVVGQPFSAWGYSVSRQEPEKFDARMILRFGEKQRAEAVGGPVRPDREGFGERGIKLSPPGAESRKPSDRLKR